MKCVNNLRLVKIWGVNNHSLFYIILYERGDKMATRSLFGGSSNRASRRSRLKEKRKND